MSLTITATLGPVRANAVLANRSERQGDGRMVAQNAAANCDVEGLRRQRTDLDRLLDRPSPLDRLSSDAAASPGT